MDKAKPDYSRRRFLSAAAAAQLLGNVSASAAAASSTGNSTILSVDYRRLVSQADITYSQPVEKSDHGLPVGNGRMCSLVWTAPNALKFQANRVDVFPICSRTRSFNRRDKDYACGCGFVDIEFDREVFPAGRTIQHLACYDGRLEVEGNGVRATVLAWNEQDVFAVRIEPGEALSIEVSLRMLRPPVVKTRNHTAVSQNLADHNGTAVLTQTFEEDDYYCGSALAIRVAGASAAVRMLSGQEARLVVQARRTPVTVLFATAAGNRRTVDLAARAEAGLAAAAAKGFDGLAASNAAWWHEFWRRSFIHVPGFREVDTTEVFYLYLMGASSRGSLPPKFNGQQWNTHGDVHQWGNQFWWWNQSTMHHSVYAANHMELNDPLFSMVTRNLERYALAARQQWGSKGIWIPETQWFDGIEPLPEEIAAELRELYLEIKPWQQMSARFREYATWPHPLSSRWEFKRADDSDGNWRDWGAGVFGYVTHTLVVAPKIAHLFWLRYQYTMDEAWLRRFAYPVLKGAAEFYRNYPLLRKESDGRYHINRTHSHEHLWGARDVMDDLALMRGVFATAIKASEMLGLDADLRPLWREVKDNLAPYPTNRTPGALLTLKHPRGLTTWAQGTEPCALVRGGGPESPRLRPLLEYDVLTLENDDPENWALAKATFDAHPACSEPKVPRFNSETGRFPTEAARMGRADRVKEHLEFRLRRLGPQVLPNRLSTLEGGGSMQWLGTTSDGIQQALLQCLASTPGANPILRVFPAWPAEWDASFQLLAKGGFLITSSMRSGQVEFVELDSQAGGECRIRNPWGASKVSVYRGENRIKDVSGPLLVVPTTKGEVIVLVKDGTTPSQYKRAIFA